MLLGSATNPDELKASMKTRMLNQPSDIQVCGNIVYVYIGT